MTTKITQVVAHAHPNIALIKYWGKRDTALNLPAVSSLSITLDSLLTTTKVAVDDSVNHDSLVLNDQPANANLAAKISQLCDIFRAHSNRTECVKINSDNNFPTAAGLASSASGYAALVVALDTLYATGLDKATLSRYARIGSGSAARSLFGGYAKMNRGRDDQGHDAFAESFMPASHWPLAVAVAITSTESKATSSTEGMESTRHTSPYYEAWLNSQDDDLGKAQVAIEQRDFASLAEISEFSCLKMHGLMMSAQPGLLYWNAATLACLHEVRLMRTQGLPVFFTVDAGPQVKVVCEPHVLESVQTRLAAIQGVREVITTGLGEGASVAAAT